MSKPRISTFVQTRDTDVWKNDLKTFIDEKLVPSIIPGTGEVSKQYRQIFSSSQAMEIWYVVFTHPSYDPRVDFNFEVYEYIGDKMLGLNLGIYMKKLYPYSTQETLNNFNTAFASKNPLAKIVKEKGILEHVRTIEILSDTKKQSDIFEAIIGGIVKIGDSLIGPSIGYYLSTIYIVSIYNWFREEHSEQRGQSGAINMVMQDYYDTLGWKKSDESKKLFEEWDKDNKTLTIILNDKAIKMLRATGKEESIGEITLHNGREQGILASGTGVDRKDATNNTYNNALNRLQKVFNISIDDARKIGIETFISSILDPEESKALIKKLYHDDRWMKQIFYIDSTRYKIVYTLMEYGFKGVIGPLYRVMFSSKPKDIGYSDDSVRIFLYQLYAKYGKLKNNQYIYYDINNPDTNIGVVLTKI